MRFMLRTAVVLNHCIFYTIILTLMRLLIRTAVVENSFYTKYYKVNINALSHKDGSSSNLILY
jgi:hypothetical protein